MSDSFKLSSIQRLNLLIIFLSLIITNSFAKQCPWLSSNNYRLILSIQKSRSQWKTTPVSFTIDLDKALKNTDVSPENLNLLGIRVIAYDMNSNPIIHQVSKSRDERYYIPYRLIDDQFPDQLTISWRIDIKNVDSFAIYFDAKSKGLQTPMKEIPLVGNGDFLSFGQRGVMGPISGGFNDIVAAGDGDGDGDLDLFVGFSGIAGKRGIYFFENRGTKTEPLLINGKSIYPNKQNFQLIDWDRDGKVEIIISGDLYKLKHQPYRLVLEKLKNISEPSDQSWKYVDWDGDGLLDLLSVNELFRNYYPSEVLWDRTKPPYSALGVWMGDNPKSTITFRKNIGSNKDMQFAKPLPLMVNDVPIELYGTLHVTVGDWDIDGDLDLIVGNSFQLILFENINNFKMPILAKGIVLKTDGGQDPFGIYVRPELADWDSDRDLDILLGNEDGRPTWIENIGNGKLGLERFVTQLDPDLDVGCSSVPVACDWDEDGDIDIICGNSTGFIEYFENKSGASGQFKFARMQRVKVQEKEIRHFGYGSGSIQGPDEAKYGYTMPEVVDWDGDGNLDLLLSDIKGEHYFYRNIGKKNKPKLADGIRLLVDWKDKPPKPSWIWWQPGKTDLITYWRCRPTAIDWNQDGLIDYITVDHEGYLAFYQAFIKENKKWLKPGQRVFQDQNGMPLRISELAGGQAGRARIIFVDWDNDGDLDIIHNAHNLFDNVNAFLKNVKNAGWFENTGSIEKAVFIWRGEIFKKNIPRISAHSTSPEHIDFDGDNKLDLLLGGEDGRIACYHRAFIENDLPTLSLLKIERRSQVSN